MIILFITNIFIFYYDIKFKIIPDSSTLIIFLYHLVFYPDNIFAAFVFFLLSSSIYFLFLKLLNIEIIGYGDIKLFSVYLIRIKDWKCFLMLAFLLGGLYSLMLLVFKRKKRNDEISFAPFIIISYYLNII